VRNGESFAFGMSVPDNPQAAANKRKHSEIEGERRELFTELPSYMMIFSGLN
jgi:hypothetical protein